VYGALWRNIPGGLAGKLSGCVALLLAALGLLFFVIFPLVEPRLPWNDVTVNSPSIVDTPSGSPSVAPTPAGSPAPSTLPAG
jgi:hypothetical protein